MSQVWKWVRSNYSLIVILYYFPNLKYFRLFTLNLAGSWVFCRDHLRVAMNRSFIFPLSWQTQVFLFIYLIFFLFIVNPKYNVVAREQIHGMTDGRTDGQMYGMTDGRTDVQVWVVMWHVAVTVTAMWRDVTDPCIARRLASRQRVITRKLRQERGFIKTLYMSAPSRKKQRICHAKLELVSPDRAKVC